MPKRIPPLSALKIGNAKPKEKEFELFDGYGLQLIVKPTGGNSGEQDIVFMAKKTPCPLELIQMFPLTMPDA
jgi:hypothetical protein